MKKRQYLLSFLTLLLLLLWIPVTIDKFWDLQAFKQTLLRQPFPSAWAEVLYWILPTAEGLCVVLLVLRTIDDPKTNKFNFSKWGFVLSSLLMLGFTLFILFGVLGWYEKRPCGCGSVIPRLTWEEHLVFNLMYLVISLYGWKLLITPNPHSSSSGQTSSIQASSLPFWMVIVGEGTIPLFLSLLLITIILLQLSKLPIIKPMRFPRKFAPFPARPVVETI